MFYSKKFQSFDKRKRTSTQITQRNRLSWKAFLAVRTQSRGRWCIWNSVTFADCGAKKIWYTRTSTNRFRPNPQRQTHGNDLIVPWSTHLKRNEQWSFLTVDLFQRTEGTSSIFPMLLQICFIHRSNVKQYWAIIDSNTS